MISGYKKLIFSDYKLDEKIFENYENNYYDFLGYDEFMHCYARNKFNKDVSNLPQGITYLTFGFRFNKNVSILPPFITHLTFGYFYSQPTQIPNSVTHLVVGQKYNQQNQLPIPSSVVDFQIRKQQFELLDRLKYAENW